MDVITDYVKSGIGSMESSYYYIDLRNTLVILAHRGFHFPDFLLFKEHFYIYHSRHNTSGIFYSSE